MKYNLVFLDTETTGNEAKDRLCQLAYKTATDSYATMFNELFKPPMDIPVDAMAVHHITNRMIADKPTFQESTFFPALKTLLEDTQTIMVAHNAKFDSQILKNDNITPSHLIDTLRLVRHLDPDMKMKKHNLQYLRYFLDLDAEVTEPIYSHDARGDVIVLELLFWRLFKKLQELSPDASEDAILDDMMRISQIPTIIAKFAFGKYKERRVADIAKEDKGYLQWLLTQKQNSDQDEEDWIYTLEHFLNS
jgi:DNA polymerase III epsilon subunit-like protein